MSNKGDQMYLYIFKKRLVLFTTQPLVYVYCVMTISTYEYCLTVFRYKILEWGFGFL